MFQDFYGKLCGTPEKRVIYDTMRYCFREVEVTDIGRGFGIQALATKYDDPNWRPDAKKVGRPDQNFQRIYDWLRINGPVFISDMAEGLGMNGGSIHTVIKRHPDDFKYSVSLITLRSGGQRTAKLWRVV